MEDVGFSKRRGTNPWVWGKNLLYGKIFAQNCLKMKGIGPRGRGGGLVSLAPPPRSANATFQAPFEITDFCKYFLDKRMWLPRKIANINILDVNGLWYKIVMVKVHPHCLTPRPRQIQIHRSLSLSSLNISTQFYRHFYFLISDFSFASPRCELILTHSWKRVVGWNIVVDWFDWNADEFCVLIYFLATRGCWVSVVMVIGHVIGITRWTVAIWWQWGRSGCAVSIWKKKNWNDIDWFFPRTYLYRD